VNTKRKGTGNAGARVRPAYACTRAAASLGVFDVVAIGSTDVMLVQVKTRGS